VRFSGNPRIVTRTQKIIVITAVLISVIAWLFPPYWKGMTDDNGNLIGKYLKWEFNKNLSDMIDPPYFMSSDGRKVLGIWEYPTADSVLGIEFLFIVVVTGVGLFIARKRGAGGEERTRRNKLSS
jgi:hypothetical protein